MSCCVGRMSGGNNLGVGEDNSFSLGGGVQLSPNGFTVETRALTDSTEVNQENDRQIHWSKVKGFQFSGASQVLSFKCN
jgi:hypothetical protein